MTAAKLLGGGIDLHKKNAWDLASLCRFHLAVELNKDLQNSDWSGELHPEQFAYAARDVAVLCALKAKLDPMLSASGLTSVASLEFALISVVADMELTGVGVRRDSWLAFVERCRRNAEAARSTAATLLQIDNVDSHKQVRGALHRQGVRTAGTGAGDLAAFAHREDVKALLRYRHSVAFMRGPGEAVVEALDRHGHGRVHAQLDPLAAPTGRFGCRSPNLLALPREADVRRAVVPADGFTFVKADYAAIELRVIAQLTGDATLLGLFAHGGDPHRRTAAAILAKSDLEVTAEERSRAKPVNFGFAFGMGPSRFVTYARSDYGVEISEVEAKRFRGTYFRTYPGIARWHRHIRMNMPREVRTLAGRLRLFESQDKGYCERLNTPVQGTAADGMKYALILLHQRLPALGARLVLCVHDEVLVEAPTDRVAEVKTVVESSMKEGMTWLLQKVPVVVEADIRSNWAGEAGS
jgi:DNA polymerase-1